MRIREVPVASRDGIMLWTRGWPRTDVNGRVTHERGNPRVGGVARSPRDRAPPPRSDGRPCPVPGVADRDPLLAPRSTIPPRSALGVPDRVARFLPLRGLRGATDFGGPPQRGVYPPAQGAEKPGPRCARRTRRRCSLFRRHRAADSGGEPAGDTGPLANDALVVVRAGDREGSPGALGGLETQQRARTGPFRAGVPDRRLRRGAGRGLYGRRSVRGAGAHRLGDLGRMGGGSLATVVILPVASFATALTYGRLRLS